MMPRLTGPRQRGTSEAKAPAIAVQVRSGFVAPCNRNNATSVSPCMPISGSAPPISAMAWRIVSLEACSVSEGRPATAQQAKSPSKPTSRSTDCARSSTTWFSRHSNATARIRWVALAVSARSGVVSQSVSALSPARSMSRKSWVISGQSNPSLCKRGHPCSLWRRGHANRARMSGIGIRSRRLWVACGVRSCSPVR